MNTHCPDCGSQLEEPRDLKHLWLRLLSCPKKCDYFLEVIDARWIYPMQRLSPGVGQKLRQADEDQIKSAVKRIKQIDCKTVSIIFFEHTILNCYDVSREYQIEYSKSKDNKTLDRTS